jgi:hypothetical protein
MKAQFKKKNIKVFAIVLDIAWAILRLIILTVRN